MMKFLAFRLQVLLIHFRIFAKHYLATFAQARTQLEIAKKVAAKSTSRLPRHFALNVYKDSFWRHPTS